MTKENKTLDDVIDLDEIADNPGERRRGDGGVYLVVADDSEEFSLALRYAARRAKKNRAHIGVLHVITVDDFQHWNDIEDRMRRELREEAEKFAWNTAKKVNDLNGLRPVIYIREGDKFDVITDVINEDHNIRSLILGTGTGASGPGKLVTYYTSKGLSKLRVPVVLLPGHLDAQKIDLLIP